MWEYVWGVYETYPSGMEAVAEAKMERPIPILVLQKFVEVR